MGAKRETQLFAEDIRPKVVVWRHARDRRFGEVHHGKLKHHRAGGQSCFHLLGELTVGRHLAVDRVNRCGRRRPRNLVPEDQAADRCRREEPRRRSGVAAMRCVFPGLERRQFASCPEQRDGEDHDAVAGARAKHRESQRACNRIQTACSKRKHDPEHPPRFDGHVLLAAACHACDGGACEPEEAGDSHDALVWRAVFIVEHGLLAVLDAEIAKGIGAVRDRWDEEILDLQAVDLEPFIFADEGALVRPIDGLIGPGVEVAHSKADRRYSDHGKGGEQSRPGTRAEVADRGADERELAEDVGVVDVE